MTKLDSLIKVAVTPNIVIKALDSRMKTLNNHLKNYGFNQKPYNDLYKKTSNQINNIKRKFQDEWFNDKVIKDRKQYNEAKKNDIILGNAIGKLSDKNKIYFGI